MKRLSALGAAAMCMSLSPFALSSAGADDVAAQAGRAVHRALPFRHAADEGIAATASPGAFLEMTDAAP